MSTTAHARRTDPSTSHAAAASVTDLRVRQRAILKVLRRRPAQGYTDEELIAAYRHGVGAGQPAQSESGIRTRRSELVTLGFVEDAGFKRTMSTGRLAKVWRVTG